MTHTVDALIPDLSVHSPLGVEGEKPRSLGRAETFTDDAVSILTSTSQLAGALLGHTFALKYKKSLPSAEAKTCSSCSENDSNNSRRKREFIPDEKKDEGYWDKRRKNNEAAKRSREKRRANDMVLERRILGLLEENARLRAELLALKFHFGLVKDPSDMSIMPLSISLCAHPPPNATHYYQPHTDGALYPSTPHTQQGSIYGLRGARLLSSHSVSDESSISTSCSSHEGSPVFFDDTLSEYGGPSPKELAEEQQNYNSHIYPLEANEGSCVNRRDSSKGLRSLPHKLRFKGPGGSNTGGEMLSSSDTRHNGLPVATVGPNIQVRNHLQVGSDSQTESQVPWSREEACGGPRQQHQSLPFGCYNSPSLQTSRDMKYTTDDISLRAQVSCLSREVAQLKRLFSQQLLSRIV
uniref:BZIP domain-containing protein n=1 Tax=Monopterus albus TaxID=43700 RepID=A0A3Q3IFU2_MONAL|nr:nuclear factor interleukin-3-regulated protein-like [Monopterus albus]XP_020451655.1 nuclear factor interleukin-3-regulated protein-like [Monopterus albus]XP_020451656.1 nuclear factor interleukin-3-regulated protein-like [Monopterus albus]